MERRARSIVPPDRRGSVLLEYLASRFTYLDRPTWERMIGLGLVKVDCRAATPGLVLERGQEVAFFPPGLAEPEVDDRFEVLYEDGDYLIVDKPPLLPCHPGGSFFERSLTRLLEPRYGKVSIATRLDRETSGLVLACRSPAAAARAQGLLSGGLVEKSYVALVWGDFPGKRLTRGNLVRDGSSAVRKKRLYIDGDGAAAMSGSEACETRFEALAVGKGFSVVSARPVTGRTHQIRATLLALGHPIVGDKLYGLDEGAFIRFASGGLSDEDRETLILPFQALHCARLLVPRAVGDPIEVRSEPPWALDGEGRPALAPGYGKGASRPSGKG